MKPPVFLSRLFTRPAATPARRSYEAAAGGRRWVGAGETAAPNAQGLAGRATILRRARHQAANNALAANAVEVWATALVGNGFTPQPGHPDKRIATALGLDWYRWALDVCDGASLVAVLALMARAVIRDGEALARIELVDTPRGTRMRLRVLDAEQLDATVNRDLGAAGQIVAGVEFDVSGTCVAYWIRPHSSDSAFATQLAAVRIPADEILHVFDRKYPGQVRGISALAPELLKFRDLDETSDALLMRLKTEALMCGFVKDVEGGTGGLRGETSGGIMETALEPGSLVNLPPGTDIVFNNPTAGGGDVTAFIRAQQREIAAGLGMPYALLTGDLSDVNYSSIRAGMIQYRQRLRLLQQTLVIDQVLGPIWRRFCEVRAHNGADRAEFDRNPEAFYEVRWILPAHEMQDPEKEIRADALAVANGFKSRAEVVQASGRDIDVLDQEIAADTFQPRASAPQETQA